MSDTSLAGTSRGYQPALPAKWPPGTNTIAQALDALAAGLVGGGAGSSFVFDPTQPAATGPVVYGTLAGAAAAAKAVGDDAATTIYCKLVAGAPFAAPGVLYDFPRNCRLMALGPQFFEIDFAAGATFSQFPRMLDSLLIRGPADMFVCSDLVTLIDLVNGAEVQISAGGGATLRAPAGRLLVILDDTGTIGDQAVQVDAGAQLIGVLSNGASVGSTSGINVSAGGFVVLFCSSRSNVPSLGCVTGAGTLQITTDDSCDIATQATGGFSIIFDSLARTVGANRLQVNGAAAPGPSGSVALGPMSPSKQAPGNFLLTAQVASQSTPGTIITYNLRRNGVNVGLPSVVVTDANGFANASLSLEDSPGPGGPYTYDLLGTVTGGPGPNVTVAANLISQETF